MRITAITPQQRRSERVNIFVDGEFRLALALEVVRELRLRCEEAVDEATLERAAAADLRWRAREAALSLLGYRARSAAELRRRLLRKEFPPPLADEIVAELAQRGHLDDADFARAFVRDRTRSRPRGRGRLTQELRARGVAGEAAADAVAAVFREDALSDEALARAVAERWLGKSGKDRSGPEARRRLHAYLARRGFFGDAARAAVAAVLPRA